MFKNTPLGRFRLIAILEGISFLSLLLIAMPLKYIAHNPQPVKIMGWIHGVLFILYIITLSIVRAKNKWSFMKTAIAFLASLVPAGTFILDSKLRTEEAPKI